MDNTKVVPGAVAPDLTKKELEIPSFVTNNKAKHVRVDRRKKSIESDELNSKIAEFVKDATEREKGIVEDLDLILDTIMKYGAPDKIKLNCTMEYDSGSKRKNKVFVIKR